MAVIGGEGGYATVNPVQENYLGNAMAYVDNLGFKYREEKAGQNKLLADAEKARREKQDADLKEAQELAKRTNISTTGIVPNDVKLKETARNLAGIYSQGTTEYRNAKTPQERTLAEIKMSKSLASIDQLKKFADDFNANTSDLIENKGDRYDPDSVTENAAETDKFYNGQYVMDTTPDGEVLVSTYDVGPDGRPSKVTGKQMNQAQLLERYRGRPNINFAGEGKGESDIQGFEKSLGKPEEIYKGGKITTSYRNGNEKSEAFAQSYINDPNRMQKIVKLMGGPVKNFNEYTPEERDAAYKYVKTISDGVVKQSAKPDYQSQQIALAKTKEANDEAERRYQRGKDAKEDVVIIGETPTVLAGKTVNGVRLTDGTKSYPIEGALIGKEGKGTQATNIFVSPNGKMFLRVEDVGFEGDSRKTSGLSEQGKRNIAAYKLKYPDDKKLDNYEMKVGDQVDITTTDRTPKGRLLDFGKDGPEISRYAQKMNTTVSGLEDKYLGKKQSKEKDETAAVIKAKALALINKYKKK